MWAIVTKIVDDYAKHGEDIKNKIYTESIPTKEEKVCVNFDKVLEFSFSKDNGTVIVINNETYFTIKENVSEIMSMLNANR